MERPGHRMKQLGAEARPAGPRDVGVRRQRLRGRAGEVRLDAEGTVRHFDPLFASVLGYRPEALAGTFFFAYVHARDLAPILPEAARLLQRRQQAALWSFRFRAADGEWFRFVARAAAGAPEAEGITLTFTERPPGRR